MGSLMAALAAGMLFLDNQFLVGWYPCLLLMLLVLGPLACRELLGLLSFLQKPTGWFCTAGVLIMLLCNWPAHVARLVGGVASHLDENPWHWALGAFAVLALFAFVVEVVGYRDDGGAVLRVALSLLMIAYLGLLPCFLIQLRWWTEPAAVGDYRGVAALALAIFVPKSGDIGAYFAGKYLGRHKMAPRLSPKKTWEGFAGGVLLSVLAAVLLNWFVPLLTSPLAAVGFGLTVNLAGVLGDLAESMLKRDGRQKDASQVVPGFGGVLDVIDSVVFAAPVAYWWLRCSPARAP
jgi:phosphatidate cytidylyltransferase